MPRTLIKPVIWIVLLLALIGGTFFLLFGNSNASESQPALSGQTITVGEDSIFLCLDPRLDSVEKGRVDFERLESAKLSGFETLVGSEIKAFGPELPPKQYSMVQDMAGRKCGPKRPEGSEVYLMSAGDFPHSGRYKAYVVDGVVKRIEGFYSNAENSPAYQDWKSQQKD